MTPVSGALHDLRLFCHFKSRLIHGYHVKEHEIQHRYIEFQKNQPFQGNKKVRGQRSDLGHFFNVKNEKIIYKNRSRLAKNFILGLNDS